MNQQTAIRLLDDIGLGTAVINPLGQLVQANRTLKEWFYLQDADLRRPCFEVFGASSQGEACEGCSLAQSLRSGTVCRIEQGACLQRGNRSFRALAAPLYADATRPVAMLLLLEDVTELAVSEQTVRQQQRLQSIETLARGVAHEINNPINAIMNYAQLICDRIDPSSTLREYAAEILQECDRVASIVRSLVAFSRPGGVVTEWVSVSDLVQPVLLLSITLLRKDNIDVRLELPEGLPQVRCCTQDIQQVLMHLLSNARDALNERHPEADTEKYIVIRARLIETGPSRWLRITVEDRGTGIDAHLVERIFEPFFTTRPPNKGKGLGLAVSHGIVREQGGRMSAESVKGQFTQIHADLPLPLDAERSTC